MNTIEFIVRLFLVIYHVVNIASLVFIFEKAGKRGWAAFIPFYNQYVLCQITMGDGWLYSYFTSFGKIVFVLFIVLSIPGMIITRCVSFFRLAKVFGKSKGFAYAIAFLTTIFLPILAFGNSKFIYSSDSNN